MKKKRKQQLLDRLMVSYKGCADCQLSKGRRNIVFYRGNVNAKLLMIGEAPGINEDEKGLPFVGDSGTELNKMITLAGLGVKRDVCIMNVVGCRPPQNRAPSISEIEACSPRTKYMIKIIDPKVILLLGGTAARMAGVTSIGLFRLTKLGIELENKTYKAVVTYHPSYYLRNGKSKSIREKIIDDIAYACEIGGVK